MKYLHILILIFLSHTMYSQSYEQIKNLDTIYIPFREGKFDIKMDYPEEKNGFKNRSYIFNNKKPKKNTFYFEFDRNSDKIIENREIDKPFLRKNKRKIVDIANLKKIDYQDITCNLFNQLKIIYILDFSEKKRKNIMLHRVISLNPCYVNE